MIGEKEKPCVGILLSSYNGEKYIREQIDSIINQDYKNWILFIRDDGSRDNTLSIINEYTCNHKNIIFYQDDIKHRGVKDSFLTLLNNVSCDLYMYCDQDDVWHYNKVSLSVSEISTLSEELPALVATDLELVDSNLNVIHSSMWTYCNMMKKISNLKFLEVRDFLTGCTMCFNQKAKDAILSLNNTDKFNLIHDQLSTIAVLKFGGNIKIINKPTISYRQHSTNVVGAKEIKNKLLYRIRHFSKLVSNEIDRYRASKCYLGTNLFRFLRLRIQSIDF